MEIFLVGGAVRDQLLGLPITERDWVVVGATPEEMLKLGYQPVGKDFPVFLHPQTHEEYALARTERKVGKGYKGFTFHSDPNITLIEDLRRRDLTINAMAWSNQGDLIDPYGGLADLKKKKLRHVSEAFLEDPVRILRIARFSARFTEFNIDSSTYQLMQSMVANGEVNALVAERVWQEFSRALSSQSPKRFLETLQDCGALQVLFPEIQLTPPVLSVFDNAISKTEDPLVRFAVLCAALNQDSLSNLCARYRIPHEYSDLALLVARWLHAYCSVSSETSASAIFLLLKSVDARRRPDRFRQFLLSCEISMPIQNQRAKEFLEQCQNEIQLIDIESLKNQGLKGSEFAAALVKMQLKVIEHIQHIFFNK